MRFAGCEGAALTGPIVGAVLAMMSWTAACRGRPRTLGRAARARFSTGNAQAGKRGAYGSGEHCGACCPVAAERPVNEPSGAWGSEGGGGGLAGCPAELARGSLAANKAALMARLAAVQRLNARTPSPPTPKRISNNSRSVPVCSSAGCLHRCPAAASRDLPGSEQLSLKGPV